MFAAGDCASDRGAARPKAGVWAVRAGAPLAANLRRAARGRPLRRWQPQSQALVILGLGDGRAIAWRNGIAVEGALVWRWKDRIDRRWMRMYGRMKPMAEKPRRPDALRRLRRQGRRGDPGLALAGLARTPSPDILVALDHPDDAAVALPPPGMAVVQSVDHFRAFIDDPFAFGQIAAAHALSDLHAMGARPWTALAIAALPYAPGGKMGRDLAAMMQGADLGAGGRRLRPGRRPHRRGRRTGTRLRGDRARRPGDASCANRACARATRWC